jgi:hypothetical protein
MNYHPEDCFLLFHDQARREGKLKKEENLQKMPLGGEKRRRVQTVRRGDRMAREEKKKVARARARVKAREMKRRRVERDRQRKEVFDLRISLSI